MTGNGHGYTSLTLTIVENDVPLAWDGEGVRPFFGIAAVLVLKRVASLGAGAGVWRWASSRGRAFWACRGVAVMTALWGILK